MARDSHYSYETQLNGGCVTIFDPDGNDIGFLQDEASTRLVDQLQRLQTLRSPLREQKMDQLLAEAARASEALRALETAYWAFRRVAESAASV